MTGADGNLTFGPVVFFGIIGIGLMTHGPVDAEYANPASTMNVALISQGVAAAHATAPFADYPPANRPALNVAVLDVPVSPAVTVAGAVPDAGILEQPSVIQVAVIEDRVAPSRPEIGGPGAATLAPMTSPSPVARPWQGQRANLAPATLPGTPNFDTSANAQIIVGDAGQALGLPSYEAVALQVILPPLSDTFARPQTVAKLAPARSGPAVPTVSKLEWASVTGDFVNLRAGPSLDAESVVQFNTGARAIVLARSEGWALVNFLEAEAPVTGWMSEDFLGLVR